MRNLQEQVQKNKEDIANHYAIDRALSNLGIKIVGQVNLQRDLPDPLTYPGEYGDTYAVGFKSDVAAGLSSYDYYVFTRPDLNAGITENQWLNVGKISIVGPIGPAGPQGREGKEGKSSKWYSGSTIPTVSSDLNDGDMYLQTNGNVYRFNKTEQSQLWTNVANIKGPQGAQGNRGLQGNIGPKGDKGDRGPKGDPAALINIYGVLANKNQLPTPSVLNNLNAAFLIGSAAPYSLYMQVGANPQVAIWQNVGVLNGVSVVTTDGVLQASWDTNTKVNKYTASVPSVYIEEPNVGSGLIPFSRDAVNNTIAVRDNNSTLNVETVPSNNKSAVNVGYLNDILSEYTPGTGGGGGGSSKAELVGTVTLMLASDGFYELPFDFEDNCYYTLDILNPVDEFMASLNGRCINGRLLTDYAYSESGAIALLYYDKTHVLIKNISNDSITSYNYHTCNIYKLPF